eukprot:SAG11_NODE_13621_length_647_cov_0.576642_1_plen_56_part_10
MCDHRSKTFYDLQLYLLHVDTLLASGTTGSIVKSTTYILLTFIIYIFWTAFCILSK